MAFLDYRPLFRGHTLLVPVAHYETLPELPADLLQPFFANGQLLIKAVTDTLSADGAFLALNHIVSQSVPHVHLHVIPRRFKDGLKGFFWPREKYENNDAMEATARGIGEAWERLRAGTAS